MGRELTNSSQTWEVFDVEFSDLHLAHTAVTQAPEARVCKDISGQGVDWLCLGSGRETRWDTEVRWRFQREVGRRPFNTAGPSLHGRQHGAALARASALFPICLLVVGKRLVPVLRSFAECRVEWWSIVGNFGTLSGRPGKCR